jgi:hypothetical protein
MDQSETPVLDALVGYRSIGRYGFTPRELINAEVLDYLRTGVAAGCTCRTLPIPS